MTKETLVNGLGQKHHVHYKELFGIVGGLGPKASAIFYDEYIIERRIQLFNVMKSSKASKERFEAVKQFSPSNWTEQEVEVVWSHTKK